MHHLRQGGCSCLILGAGIGILLLRDLRRHGIYRFRQHCHGQLVQIPIVENASPRRHFKGTLLLFVRALDEFRVAQDLQPNQAAADRCDPEKEEECNVQEAQAAWSDRNQGARCRRLPPDGG